MAPLHTFATLEVSPGTYEEISKKLREAGYDHAFIADQRPLIDMHGIALVRGNVPTRQRLVPQRWLVGGEDYEAWVSLFLNTDVAALREALRELCDEDPLFRGRWEEFKAKLKAFDENNATPP